MDLGYVDSFVYQHYMPGPFALYYPASDSSHEYRKMVFQWEDSSGTIVGGAYFYHATNIENPLIRYVKSYDISRGAFNSWKQLDPNVLY
jgi:hypothetical protein